MAIGLQNRRKRAVSLEEGAGPGTSRCPACGEPLFVWVETLGYGKREDQVIDRCENCGLAVARGSVPTSDEAVAELLRHSGKRHGRVAIRAHNAASLQAWLGAENWAALAPGTGEIKPTPRAARLLLARRGLHVRRVHHRAGPGIAGMWQTLLNLLTFHRDFASEAASDGFAPAAAGDGRRSGSTPSSLCWPRFQPPSSPCCWSPGRFWPDAAV